MKDSNKPYILSDPIRHSSGTPVFRFPRPWTPDPELQQIIERECRKIDAVFCAERVVALCSGKVNDVFLDDRELYLSDLSA